MKEIIFMRERGKERDRKRGRNLKYILEFFLIDIVFNRYKCVCSIKSMLFYDYLIGIV